RLRGQIACPDQLAGGIPGNLTGKVERAPAILFHGMRETEMRRTVHIVRIDGFAFHNPLLKVCGPIAMFQRLGAKAAHLPASCCASMKPEPAPVPAPGQVAAPTRCRPETG